jgi:hypothetical protein
MASQQLYEGPTGAGVACSEHADMPSTARHVNVTNRQSFTRVEPIGVAKFG